MHKQSKKLADAYDVICIENLNMRAMAQELHLGKSVTDNGWGMFTGFLHYKLEERGKYLVKVDRYYPSSQICYVCGYKNTETKIFRSGYGIVRYAKLTMTGILMQQKISVKKGYVCCLHK